MRKRNQQWEKQGNWAKTKSDVKWASYVKDKTSLHWVNTWESQIKPIDAAVWAEDGTVKMRTIKVKGRVFTAQLLITPLF